MKKLLFALLLLCSSALAQNYTTVSASNIQYLNQAKVTGQICFLGTNSSNIPISFQAGGGGQVAAYPMCQTVTNGAIIGTLNVPNPALTTPANICYRVRVSDNTYGEVLSYNCVTWASSSTFNFDLYVPNVGTITGTSISSLAVGSLTVTSETVSTLTITGTCVGCPGGSIQVNGVTVPPTGNAVNVQNGTGTTASNPSANNIQVAVNYGTTSGTAAQGNDSRIVNALQPNVVNRITYGPMIFRPTIDMPALMIHGFAGGVNPVISVSGDSEIAIGNTACTRTSNVMTCNASNTLVLNDRVQMDGQNCATSITGSWVVTAPLSTSQFSFASVGGNETCGGGWASIETSNSDASGNTNWRANTFRAGNGSSATQGHWDIFGDQANHGGYTCWYNAAGTKQVCVVASLTNGRLMIVTSGAGQLDDSTKYAMLQSDVLGCAQMPTLTGDVSNVNCAITLTKALYYQTLKINQTAQTQRPNLNFSTEFTNTDDGANNSSDIALASASIADGKLASAYSGTGACPAHQWASTLTRNAAPTCSQPLFSDISGTATAAQIPGTLNAETFTGNIDIQGNGLVIEIANAGTTGTSTNLTACLTGAPSTVVKCSAGATDGVIGVVVAGAGTTGNAQIVIKGIAGCTFDNATTAGDYVQLSTGTAGDCHDSGASRPTSGGVILGRVLVTNASSGQVNNMSVWGGMTVPSTSSNYSLVQSTCSGTFTSSLTNVQFPGLGGVTGACASNGIIGQLKLASAHTFQTIAVTCKTAGVNASSGVFTLYKNNSSTSQTCTVGTATTCNDTAHSVSYSAGDTYDVRMSTQAAETLAACTVILEMN